MHQTVYFVCKQTVLFYLSTVHALKVKTRSKLSIQTLDALTRLKLNTVEWRKHDLSQAFQLWLDNSERGRYFASHEKNSVEAEKCDKFIITPDALNRDLIGCFDNS